MSKYKVWCHPAESEPAAPNVTCDPANLLDEVKGFAVARYEGANDKWRGSGIKVKGEDDVVRTFDATIDFEPVAAVVEVKAD